MKTRKTQGFTLVEIMIVVVIIGLLAAMAIPAFQKVRQNSRRGALINDARQLGSAAQQYMLEHSVIVVEFGIHSPTGALSGPLLEYVKTVGKGTRVDDGFIEMDGSFALSHLQVKGGDGTEDVGEAVYFNSEGQLYNNTGASS